MKSFIAKLNKANFASANEYIFLFLVLWFTFSIGVGNHDAYGESFGTTLWRCTWATPCFFFGQRMLRRIPKGIVFVVKYVITEVKKTFTD